MTDINFILGESGNLIGGKRLPRVVPQNVNPELDTLFSNTKDIAKEVTGKAKGIPIKNTFNKYAPFVSDFVDIGAGKRSWENGHPFIGAGQIGLGLVGLGLDTGALLAAPFTGGTSFVGEQVAKQAGKQAIKTGAKNLLKIAAKAQANKLTGPGARLAYTTGLEFLKRGNDNDVVVSTINQGKDMNKQPNKQQNNQSQATPQYTNVPQIDVVPNGNMDDFVRQVVAAYGINADKSNANVPNIGLQIDGSVQQGTQPVNSNIQALLDMYNKQTELTEPYREGLRNYIDNYRELQRQAYLRDVQRAGINDYIHGTNTASQLLGKYNQADIEATRLDLINKLAQNQTAQLQGMNELVGNVGVVQNYGMPIETALANKNLLNTAAAMSRADASRYNAELRYNAKVLDTMLDAAIRQAEQNQDVALKQQLEQMRGQNRVNVAILQGAGYGNLNNVLQAANALGVVNVDPQLLQQALQQTSNGIIR